MRPRGPPGPRDPLERSSRSSYGLTVSPPKDHLRPEHVERHRGLCVDFLHASRTLGSYPEPDYEGLAARLNHPPAADVGYAATRVRLLTACGLTEDTAMRRTVGLMGRDRGGSEDLWGLES